MDATSPAPASIARTPLLRGSRLVGAIVATFAVYVAAAAMGLALARLHANVSPLWPASGVGLAALLLFGQRAWPGIAAGAFVANACTGIGAWAAAAIAVGNTLEAVFGRMLVRSVEHRSAVLGPFTRPTAFLLAGALAPAVSALGGSATLVLAGSAPRTDAAALCLTWWIGDAMGVMTFASLAVAAAGSARAWRRLDARGAMRIATFAVLGIATCALLFRPHGSGGWYFLAFPLVLLATAMFGRGGALASATAIAGFAVVGTVAGDAPAHDAHERLLLLEVFLGALVVTALYLGEFLRAARSPLPTALMLAGWGLGGWLFATLEHGALRLDRQRLQHFVRDAELRVEQRMQTYVDALLAAASLHAASQAVDRGEWRTFAGSLDMVRRYPGIMGIGVVAPVHATDRDAFVTAERADHPGFAIQAVPEAERPVVGPGEAEHFVIRFVEPMATNAPALGLDLGSEQRRRDAARAACDTGEPRITERVTLVQDTEARPGFLLFVPFYAGGGVPASVVERRSSLVGWIYAPFLTESFLEGVLGTNAAHIALRCYGGDAPAPANLLYATTTTPPDHRPEIVTTLSLCGRQLTLGWDRGPEFTTTARGTNMLTGAALALLAMLTAGFVHSLQTLRQRADDLATARTRELEEANHRLAEQMRERERAESDAKQARTAAEVASRSKSDFLATMSHEIRTPLNSVIGFSDLIRQSALSDEQRGWADCVQTAGRALLSLISDILDFSKIEAGKLEIESIAFSPLGIAQSVVDMLSARAAAQGVGLVLEVASPPPRLVLGDPNRCLQVLLNLAGNALKFTAAGEVRVRLACIATSPTRVRIRFEVRDTGIGIPADKVAGLFREFSQADASTTRRYGGTGLGLAISKRLVELMGGAIGVESTPGVGSTFHFELPAISVPAPAANGQRPPTPALPAAAARPALLVRKERIDVPRRVLVAEDVPMNRTLIKAMLRREKCEVDFAGDGAEAVAKSADAPYDLVLMDCQMPDVDGFEATRRIRAREHTNRTRRLPIVALTANALEGDRARCLAAGMDDYLTKPIRSEDFTRVLSAWLCV